MPKIKQMVKCKHPNSRKTLALAKNLRRQTGKQKLKLAGQIKQSLIGEKLDWFRDYLNPDATSVTPQEIQQMVETYLGRFNDEMEQINLKHSVGLRKSRQHASREDVIKMTMKREQEEYVSVGIEIPDLIDPGQLKRLKEWTGELRFLHNFKLQRFKKPKGN